MPLRFSSAFVATQYGHETFAKTTTLLPCMSCWTLARLSAVGIDDEVDKLEPILLILTRHQSSMNSRKETAVLYDDGDDVRPSHSGGIHQIRLSTAMMAELVWRVYKPAATD
jgi:hypothetical protein